MKTNPLLLLPLALLAGCQSSPPPPAAPAVTRPLPAAWPEAANVRTPEVVKTYTIGAYVDPDDPTLRHEAHTVHRIEAAAHWDLRPAGETLAAKPRIPHRAESSTLSPVPTPALARVTPPAAELAVDPEPALVPNADGLIDLTVADAPSSEEANPFAVRSAPAHPPREFELQLTAILAGAKPCAVLNGRLVEPGGTLEGFTLRRIEPEAVVLTRGPHRLRVPLASGPVRVRATP